MITNITMSGYIHAVSSDATVLVLPSFNMLRYKALQCLKDFIGDTTA